MHDWHIEPGVGVGPIALGMSGQKIRRILGRNQTMQDWMDPIFDGLAYPGLFVHLVPSTGCWPLYSEVVDRIDICEHDSAELYSRYYRLWRRDELVAALETKNVEVKHNSTGDICVPRLGMEVEFDALGRAYSICIERSTRSP